MTHIGCCILYSWRIVVVLHRIRHHEQYATMNRFCASARASPLRSPSFSTFCGNHVKRFNSCKCCFVSFAPLAAVHVLNGKRHTCSTRMPEGGNDISPLWNIMQQAFDTIITERCRNLCTTAFSLVRVIFGNTAMMLSDRLTVCINMVIITNNLNLTSCPNTLKPQDSVLLSPNWSQSGCLGAEDYAESTAGKLQQRIYGRHHVQKSTQLHQGHPLISTTGTWYGEVLS
jgi:hypothetical protein